MLDAKLKSQVEAHLERISRPVVLVASVDDGETSRELLALLEEVASLHPQLGLRVERGGGERTPSFGIASEGEARVRFASDARENVGASRARKRSA